MKVEAFGARVKRSLEPGTMLAILLWAPWPSTAFADGVTGSVGLLTEKVVRGLGQSGGRPSAVIDLAYRTDGDWGVQAGAATLGGRSEQAALEWTLGGSRSGQWGADGSWLLSATKYVYQRRGSGGQRGYDELSATVGWGGQVFVSLAIAPRLTVASLPADQRRTGPVLIAEATWHRPLAHRFAFDAGLGTVDYGSLAVTDYRYGSVGLSWASGPVTVFVSRIHSGSTLPSSVGSKTVASILVSF